MFLRNGVVACIATPGAVLAPSSQDESCDPRNRDDAGQERGKALSKGHHEFNPQVDLQAEPPPGPCRSEGQTQVLHARDAGLSHTFCADGGEWPHPAANDCGPVVPFLAQCSQARNPRPTIGCGSIAGRRFAELFLQGALQPRRRTLHFWAGRAGLP